MYLSFVKITPTQIAGMPNPRLPNLRDCRPLLQMPCWLAKHLEIRPRCLAGRGCIGHRIVIRAFWPHPHRVDLRVCLEIVGRVDAIFASTQSELIWLQQMVQFKPDLLWTNSGKRYQYVRVTEVAGIRRAIGACQCRTGSRRNTPRYQQLQASPEWLLANYFAR